MWTPESIDFVCECASFDWCQICHLSSFLCEYHASRSISRFVFREMIVRCACWFDFSRRSLTHRSLLISFVILSFVYKLLTLLFFLSVKEAEAEAEEENRQKFSIISSIRAYRSETTTTTTTRYDTTMSGEGQGLSHINYSLQDYSTSIEYFDKVHLCDRQRKDYSQIVSLCLATENCKRVQRSSWSTSCTCQSWQCSSISRRHRQISLSLSVKITLFIEDEYFVCLIKGSNIDWWSDEWCIVC